MKRSHRKRMVNAFSALKAAFILWDEGREESGSKRPHAFSLLYVINRDGECKAQVTATETKCQSLN